ncbi:MAG: TerL, partial [Deltaproteobacteria bacterium]
TWLRAFPEDEFGRFLYSDMTHHIVGDDYDFEFIFRSLDKPADIKKLLSLELTFAWINEAREIYSKGLILGLLDAIGRYPSVEDGGPTWWGIMMDTNPPDTDHWWYKTFDSPVKPHNWQLWKQPPALLEQDGKFVPNPRAENIGHITGGFGWYLDRAASATRDHILVYYCNQYGFIVEGKPVFPEYHDSLHCPGDILEPMPGLPIFVGLDFGLTPAALFSQRLVNGRWIWFDEIVSQDMGIQRFSEALKPRLNQYLGWKDKIQIYGDPAGNQKAQTDEKTCYQILEACGVQAEPAPSNVFTLRREAVAGSMTRIIDGKPGFLISPKCEMSRKGLQGGYHFRRIQVMNEERYHEEPEKNQYSHVVEAGGYAMLGAGEGDLLIKRETPKFLKGFGRGESHSPNAWMGA